MSANDIVEIHADTNYATLDDLRLGRSSQQVVVRLLRYWDSKNDKKDGEFLGTVLLFLDEKCSMIHGFIPPSLANQFVPVLKEGAIFNLGEFEVGRCTNLYKITGHPLVIRFLQSTNIVEVCYGGPTIETEKFRVRKLDHLQALANTNLEHPDVVGHIHFVQGTNLADATCTERLIVRYRIDTLATVTLTLWDGAAANFRGFFSGDTNMNSVMLVTTVKPKLFGGNLFLESTPATKFFFDNKLWPINEFTKRLAIEAGIKFGQADTSKGVSKKETLSIRELYSYISLPSEQTQVAEFHCKATIVGVLKRNGWNYVSCSSCSRKIEKKKARDYGATNVYRVELAVHDGHHRATFVVFDNEMTKYTTQNAETLTLEAVDGAASNSLPNCLQNLAAKKFKFEIKVSPTNFTSKQHTFIVTRMIEDPTHGDGGQVPQPNEINTSQVNSNMGTTTRVGLSKIELNVGNIDRTAGNEVGESEKTRKRHRE